MIFSRSDFPYLKWPLLIFLLALCIASTVIAASDGFAVRAHGEKQAAQRRLETARLRLASAVEDQRNMKDYALEYRHLLERNVIGDGQRLGWIEGMEEIRRQHRVLNFNYTIAPQHHYTPASNTDSGHFESSMSGMALHFDLLHEEQLMDFFDRLHSGTHGWFILDGCTIERGADTDAAPRLTAVCAGAWLTLSDKGAA